MKTTEWLKCFRENIDTKIFHIRYFQLFTGMFLPSLRVSLHRLVEKGVVKRICRGYYANPFNTPSLEEVAVQIYNPSYVSLESAFFYWGILSQIPQVLTMITTKLPYKIITEFGSIEYRQIKKKYFCGFLKKNNFFIAEPEKALADYIYLNKNISNLSELHLEGLKKRDFRNIPV